MFLENEWLFSFQTFGVYRFVKNLQVCPGSLFKGRESIRRIDVRHLHELLTAAGLSLAQARQVTEGRLMRRHDTQSLPTFVAGCQMGHDGWDVRCGWSDGRCVASRNGACRQARVQRRSGRFELGHIARTGGAAWRCDVAGRRRPLDQVDTARRLCSKKSSGSSCLPMRRRWHALPAQSRRS